MFRNPGTDLIIVLVIVLLILGPKRIPALMKSLGQGTREFKEGIGSDKDDDAEKPAIAPAQSNPIPAPRQDSTPPATGQGHGVGSERRS
jgi:TatA/E family protein of Tat protein translocase